MAIPVNALRVIVLYFNTIPSIQIGNRLEQIWNGLQQAQRDQMSVHVKKLYYRMFVQNLTFETDPVQTIIDIEPILTDPQRTQIFNILKTDLVNWYNLQKDDIDDDITDVQGIDV